MVGGSTFSSSSMFPISLAVSALQLDSCSSTVSMGTKTRFWMEQSSPLKWWPIFVVWPFLNFFVTAMCLLTHSLSVLFVQRIFCGGLYI